MAVHSVSDVTRYIKSMFEGEAILSDILIRGELSNFKRYPSGHCYFTLKDAGASMKCVMFNGYARSLRFTPENGMQIVAGGSVSVYERDGAYQLYVNTMTVEGAGALALSFEQLKEKLFNEGLFDEAHKRPLPRFPRRIGIVTSRAGAVLRDIYKVSKRRWPSIQLVLHPVLVQGAEAAEQIAAAIGFFNEKYPVDVLIVGRGGGSAEDLWAFNEEPVVRAIYASRIPVISAVGHETDTTLADFVSDRRAATPSQAAELAVPDSTEMRQFLVSLDTRLNAARRRRTAECRMRLEALTERPWRRNPKMLIASYMQRTDRTERRLHSAAERRRNEERHKLELAIKRLELLNPVRLLYRGFSIVEKGGRTVCRAKELTCGDRLRITFADGKVAAVVADRLKEEQHGA
ncbi:exodeoxyribonuclease VII large subunit [Selenomonas sp. F0473]|uniref:exodeoxyribonuclease VII large subunit n=1 Tax=Selenomonas sp. F0473 TaxID=999423 RepID=UPI00029DE242|nr:exodeoxyribonuclease VII large subunit [Selenomonas sp. F0473]EKU71526.1 exodeoxyribonuclease VII, large subunit [Selenomonas sp. F0473]